MKKKLCPICSEKISGSNLDSHLFDFHGFETERDAYIKTQISGVIPLCGCGCGLETIFGGWKRGFSRFLRGHNGNITKCYDADKASQIVELRRQKLLGRPGWSKGLTKETDSRVKERSDLAAQGTRQYFLENDSWSKGLTKETDSRIQHAADSARERFRSGTQVSWHKGKNKKTDPGLQKMSESIREGHRTGRIVAWHKGRKKENCEGLQRLSDSIKKSVSKNDSFSHLRLSHEEIVRRLEENPNLVLITQLEEYRNNSVKNLVFRCMTCNTMSQRNLLSALGGRCWTCQPETVSRGQIEISDFIKSIGFGTVINDRTSISPFEIDVLVPALGIGIEFNGLFWHSELFRDKEYHSLKSEMARSAGIRMIHVFEDEWRNKENIVKSMILHKCGKTERKIFARKCKVRELSSKERRDFFNKTHIDGDVQCKKSLGLFLGQEIIAGISFRSPNHQKYSEHIEIARFSTANNTAVIGALSRLVKAGERWAHQLGYRKILSYVDTRHGDGLGYVKSGFMRLGVTQNRFWWTDDINRYDRFKFKADKSAGLTERQVAEMNGMKKIWGCPNLILERDIKP